MANSKLQCRCGCKDRERPENMLITPNGLAFINAEHKIRYALRAGAKLRQSTERAAKAKAKAEKQESARKKKDHYAKDAAHQRKLTQTACNKLCLLLDAGKPCISSGLPDDGKPRKRNASHFKSVGSNSFLRYSLMNLHAATAHDNNFKSGNIEGYRKGLLERYGQPLIDYLDTAPRVKVWTCEELISLREVFAEEVRRLKRGEPASRDWRALPVTP